MRTESDFEKEIMSTGIFKTNSDILMYLLMKCIGAHTGPVGSWVLQAETNARGIQCSTATIGRHLKMLDSAGYTQLHGNQGRTLSALGQSRLSELEEQVARAQFHEITSQEIHITKYAELVDLIRARKPIEIEAARLAALHATPEQITALMQIGTVYHNYVEEKADPLDPALDYHLMVVESSHNKFLKAMLRMLLYEERQLEEKIEVLCTRLRGPVYVVDHDNIALAIAKRDADTAAHLMEAHIDQIISDVQLQTEDFEHFLQTNPNLLPEAYTYSQNTISPLI